MPTVSTSSGKRFDVDAGETVLDAALRAGVTLDHSCRTGRCSTCKARVLGGDTTALHDETGLEPGEREAGWILTCVRSVQSDTTLEVEDLGDVRLSPTRTLPCRIQSLERLAPDVVKVMLRLPPGADFMWRPGQYIDVIGPGGMRRSYSIANAPAEDKLVELHIREVPGGEMSAYWFGPAKANDLLRLNGPLGTFFLRDRDDFDLVFLATGTGIAPVKAMLENLARQPAPGVRSVAVYWGGRHPEDLYWDARQPAAGQRFVPVLSRASADWNGARGHVQDVLLTEARDWTRTAVYACGSDDMIHAARRQLTAAGLDVHRFHSDAFVCSAAA